MSIIYKDVTYCKHVCFVLIGMFCLLVSDVYWYSFGKVCYHIHTDELMCAVVCFTDKSNHTLHDLLLYRLQCSRTDSLTHNSAGLNLCFIITGLTVSQCV